MGKYLIFLGSILIVVGYMMQVKPHSMRAQTSEKETERVEAQQQTLFSWFGNLPGDIYYKSGQTTVYAPLTSMLIVSLVLSLILKLFKTGM